MRYVNARNLRSGATLADGRTVGSVHWVITADGWPWVTVMFTDGTSWAGAENNVFALA